MKSNKAQLTENLLVVAKNALNVRPWRWMQSDSNENGIHRNDKHFDKIDAAATAAATAATISRAQKVL